MKYMFAYLLRWIGATVLMLCFAAVLASLFYKGLPYRESLALLAESVHGFYLIFACCLGLYVAHLTRVKAA
jgi:Co/Zn/Cd efflux system component